LEPNKNNKTITVEETKVNTSKVLTLFEKDTGTNRLD